jgi:hypothetical protein
MDCQQARFQGGSEYYPAVVLHVHGALAFFDLAYDDGDFESRVPARFVQLPAV